MRLPPIFRNPWRKGRATVFLSFAGAAPRESARADDWARRLRDAGYEVIDHGRHISYDLIMKDLARSDATVALISDGGGTWAAIEHTSSVEGRDTKDSSHRSWRPKPTFFWFAERVMDDGSRSPAKIYSYVAEMLESGQAVRLPDDFEAAVERVCEILGPTGG